jgi:hypothetical protein
MSGERRSSGGGAFFVLLLVFGFVVTFWWVFAIIIGLLLLVAGVWLLSRWLDARDAARDAALAAIAARADEQHALILAGDDRGVYGDYPPAEMTQS